MDDLIVNYLQVSNSVEYSQEVFRSFKLMNDFEYTDPYSGFIDVLTNESYETPDQLQDDFDYKLNMILDSMLKEHNIVLVSDATLVQKNELLSALYAIQYLIDYNPILITLETFKTNEEKIACILEDYCQLDASEIISIIDTFNPETLTLLKQYIETKTTDVAFEAIDASLIKTLKTFFKLYGTNNVGYILIDSGMKPGNSFLNYLEFTGSIAINDNTQTALNILSLIYISSDYKDNALAVFHQHSNVLIQNLTQIGEIEKIIITMINKVNEYLEAEKQKEAL